MALGGLVPPPLQPTINIRPHPPATRKQCTSRAGHRLGWARTPSFLPRAPPRVPGGTSSTSPLRTIPKHDRPLLRPKPSSGLFRPTTLPPLRWSAPTKTPRTLTILLDRLSGRPMFSAAPTIVPSRLGQYFPRAVGAQPPPLKL